MQSRREKRLALVPFRSGAPKLRGAAARNPDERDDVPGAGDEPELSGVVELIEEQDQCFEKAPRWAETFAAIAERMPRLERLSLEVRGTLDDDGLAPLFAKSSKVSSRRLCSRAPA